MSVPPRGPVIPESKPQGLLRVCPLHEPASPLTAPIETGRQRLIRNPFLRCAIIASILLAITLFFVGQQVVWRAIRGESMDLRALFFRQLVYWSLWGPLIPIILAGVRRFPLEPGLIRSHIWPNLGLALVIAPAHEIVYMMVAFAVVTGSSASEAVGYLSTNLASIPGNAFTGFYKYWVLVALYSVLHYYRRFQVERRRADQLILEKSGLEADLRLAQLDALKMQLQPHFLFNTLNTISFLMKEDVDTANRMLLRFSELLRMSMEEGAAPTGSLGGEVEFIRRYLDIEAIRFEDRFAVTIQMEPGVQDASVPFMILQPIAENAVRHGVERHVSAGTISVRASRLADRVQVEVRDDGPGFSAPGSGGGNGLGLANSRERLSRMFDGKSTLETVNAEPRGAIVRFSFPYIPVERT